MARFILVRLSEALIAVWGVVTLVFFVTRVLGDPTVLLLPVGAGQAELDAMRHALGLDRPLYQQYAIRCGPCCTGISASLFSTCSRRLTWCCGICPPP